MKIRKNSLGVVFGLMFIYALSFTSALGLNAYNQSIYNTTKTSGQDLPFTFYIENLGSYNLMNVSIESNSYVSFPKFNINSGEVKLVTAIIYGNENFNRAFNINGYYIAETGMEPVTHNINIYSTGSGAVEIDKCDFTAKIGDNSIWTNSVNAPIKLTKDTPTGIEITTIPINGTFSDSILFNSPGTLTYWFIRSGMYWHPCVITIVNNSGPIIDPQLSTNISLNIQMNYPPTTINYTILNNDYTISNKNYTINVFNSKTGFVYVTNTGSTIAKNVVLNGDWFSFSQNNIDINPSQTAVFYWTLSPVIYNTNGTNKHYSKTLTFSGNFNTANEMFDVYVPYMNLENATTTSNYDTLMDIIKQWCNEHPSESFCSNESQVIYVGNGSDATFNVTFGAEQVKGIFNYMFKTGDNLDTLGNYIKEHFDSMGNTLNDQGNKTSNIDARLTALEDRQNNSSTAMVFIFILGSLLLFSGMVGTIIYIVKIKNRKRDLNRF